MTNRRVYSIPELLRLRPPKKQTVPPRRSAPLTIPRRPSPSPTRSPPSRTRHQTLSVSPPATSRSTLLFDGSEAARNTRTAPLLPPGFGLPRANGASSLPKNATNGATLLPKNTTNGTALPPKNGASNGGRGDRGERRIAKGPNLSANFASRIAFANRVVSQPPPQSSPKTVQREHDPRRDLELSTEIDRLFAKETNEPTINSKPPTIQSNRPSAATGKSTVDKKQSRFASASSLEDAVTLASVAYSSKSEMADKESKVVTDGETSTAKDDLEVDAADISFDDFAKQLAAANVRTDNAEQIVEQITSPQTEPGPANEGNSREAVKTDQTVEALAKWFSSLAAAADVVEGNSSSNYSVEADHHTSEETKSNHPIDDHSQISRTNKPMIKESATTEANDEEIESMEFKERNKQQELQRSDDEIDENLLSYFESVLKRTLNGDMMEWALDSRVGDKIEDMYESIEFDVEDLCLSQGQTVH